MKEEFNLQFFDIQYKEGIIEFLNENNEIDFIIINEKIPGEYKIDNLIDDIYKINKKIKIILISKNHYKNIYNEIEEYNFEIIKETIYKKNSKKTKKENISYENKKDNKSKEKNKVEENIHNNYYINNECDYNQIYTQVNINSKVKKNGKVMSVIGSNGVGKSIFSVMLSRKLINKKIVIIDFDFFNESLHLILNVEKYSKKVKKYSKKSKFNIVDFIIETKYENIDLISGLSLIFNYEKEKNPEKIESIIKQLRKLYDFVIIDTSLQTFLDYTKKILEVADENIMISGANLLEVKKTKRLLQIYNEEWNISKNKIKLIFNKCTKNSIDKRVLKKIFTGYKIIGKIKLSNYYDVVINNSTSKINIVEKEIKDIGDKIIKENKKYKIVK